MQQFNLTVPVVLDISAIVQAEITKQLPEIIKAVTAQLGNQSPVPTRQGDGIYDDVIAVLEEMFPVGELRQLGLGAYIEQYVKHSQVRVEDIVDLDERVKEIAEEVLDNYDFSGIDVDDQISQWVDSHGDEISAVVSVPDSDIEDAVSNWINNHGEEITEAVDLDKLRDAITDCDPLRVVADALMGAARDIKNQS